ncbi:MAG: 2-amino-4-hydroxy-6-hydroxymethyldihydropteridine diphosphokinase [Candidatus Promineifilaceae bacterium]
MSTVYLSLGTNVGDRWQNLRDAIKSLGGLIQIETVSSIYETEPWGPVHDQPYFLNCCVSGYSDLESEQLLVALKRLEERLGARNVKRWGPRLIDIDVISIGQVQLTYGRWKLPKPLIETQAFVLIPLQEIAPQWRHPASGCLAEELLQAVDRRGVVLAGDLYDEEVGALSD